MRSTTENIAMSDDQVNILLVDDKPERLLSYEVALSRLGHNLVRAGSGTEALSLLMKMEFAAILLDVSMPDMDGFETASLIRGHPRFEETPIIFVTGVHITEIDQRKGYSMGAVDYVQIPVVPEILCGKVRALVQLYLQRAELSRLNRELATANAELAEAHEKLKAENTRELQQLNQTLEKANSELVATNEHLTREVAERQRAEKELNQASRRKDEYIAVLAHELRNPLSAIHNAVQVMQLEAATEEQLRWAQELLQRQVKHLTCLMDDLLDVSRISNGRIQLRREPLELSVVVTQATEAVAPQLNEHGHTLKIDLPEEILCVDGDAVRLTQVLGNLLTNASKYMDDGGEIHLSLEQEEKWAVLRVKDQGVGIPQELLSSVFDLFVQAPTALNRAEGGLGIGLALVRALVELHGGKTAVTSDGPGCGAEFVVYLPLVTEKPREETAPAIPTPADAALRILLIDDNEDSANGLAICLESHGYEVHVCHTGASGIARAGKSTPDVILLDIGLPDIDGYEVATRLRREDVLYRVPIVAMTGYGGEANKNKAKSAGFDHYLVKPVDYSRLLHLLNNEITAESNAVPAQD